MIIHGHGLLTKGLLTIICSYQKQKIIYGFTNIEHQHEKCTFSQQYLYRNKSLYSSSFSHVGRENVKQIRKQTVLSFGESTWEVILPNADLRAYGLLLPMNTNLR